MASIRVWDLFREERDAGLNIFAGGREVVDHVPLTEAEQDAVHRVVDLMVRMLRRIAPPLADDVEFQRNAFVKWAGVAKGIFPEEKPISFPSEPGTIGVNPIIPQAVKYTTSPSSSAPAYTDYNGNTWEISLTAGTAAYLLGSSANYYKASPTTGQHSFMVIAQNGIVEVGSTPSFNQFKYETEVANKYGVVAVHPLTDVSIVEEKPIYQYPTLGMIPVFHDLGIKISAMPVASRTADVRLVGLVFYEHDFLSSLTYRS